MSSYAIKPNIGFHLDPGWEIMNSILVPVHIKEFQWRQSSRKISIVHAQVEVTAQSSIHAIRTVCIAQSCEHVIAMTIPHSIGDQDVLFDYNSDGDDDDSE